MPLTVARVCILLMLCGLLAPLGAQEPIPTLAEADQPPSEVMILGVFHFHNPNADYAQFEGIDVLAPQRQREVEVVVEALEHFGRPGSRSSALRLRTSPRTATPWAIGRASLI